MNAIDNKSKFVLAHKFVDERNKEKCIEFFKEIKDNCYEQIIQIYQKEKNKKVKDRKLVTFVSDKFANYKSAWSKLFYGVSKLNFGVPIAAKKYGFEHNNNLIERYNGKLKDRLKTMRGGFGSFERAESFMNLKRVIHNFINPHQGLKGKTPAEMTGINLNLGRNKLLGLIKFVSLGDITKR